MKKNALTFIDQENVTIDFKNHINDEDNKRILFSARFGTGKSTFLKNFFEKEKGYIALKLYPVNYSISHNRDVFELIKYDLIYELLSKYPYNVNLEKDDYSAVLLSQMFILHGLKIDPLVKSILKAAVPGSDVYTDILDKLSEILKQYSIYEKKVVNDETETLLKYIQQLKIAKGSPHEYDEISSLITKMLDNVKASIIQNDGTDNNETGIEQSKTQPTTVLIIDDIDRLDPEHVFRLFNIFSAHYDSVNDENKFGFDKVIFVCDYDNIRLMYEHRYGAGVDFSGYIDKFYSHEIFNYDNRKYVKNLLLNIFKEKPINLSPTLQSKYYPKETNYFFNAFEYILSALFEVNAITLRNLDQFNCYDLPEYSIVTGNNNYRYPAKNFPFLNLLHLIKKLIDVKLFEKYLNILMNRVEIDSSSLNSISPHYETVQSYLKEISLEFIIDSKEYFKSGAVSDNEKNGTINLNGKVIYYSLNRDMNSRMRYAYFREPNEGEANHKSQQQNVFAFLLDALNKSELFIKVNS